jgi:hypothetical protein
MKMENIKTREKVELSRDILYNLIGSYGGNGDFEGWRFVDDEITSSDPEDGGAEHSSIILRIEDEKYFLFDWNDWDRENNHDGGNFRQETYVVEEVFPKQITTTVYE